MKPVEITIKTATRHALLAECVRLLIQVSPRAQTVTLRKALQKHQRDYRTYVEWQHLVDLLIGEYGPQPRPLPVTAEGMVEWACDILFTTLEAAGFVGTTDETLQFRDRQKGVMVKIIGRQGVQNVHVKLSSSTNPNDGMTILYAASCAFKSVELLVRQWEKWKADAGPR